MPLPMVHLSIAKQIESKMNWEPNGSYYVGNIAPDAIHMRSDTNADDKSRCHLNCKDYDNDSDIEDHIQKFYHSQCLSNQSENHRMFTLGYCIHLLSDYFWFNSMFSLFSELIPDNTDSETRRHYYYHDTDLMDFKIYGKAPWRHEVWELLKGSENHSNNFLTDLEINMWIDRTLNWFNNEKFDRNEKTLYLHNDIIEKFIKETPLKIITILSDIIKNNNPTSR